MVGKHFKIAAFVFAFVCSAMQSIANNVLLINSYHNGYFWTDMLTEGIKHELKSEPNVNLYVEYLDTKRNPNHCFTPEFLKNLAHKYNDIVFELLILTDNDALDLYLLNQNHPLLRNKPVIALGISDIENYPQLEHLYFLKEATSFAENFEQMNLLFPKIDTVFFVSDRLKSGLILREEAQSLVKNTYPHWAISFIDSFEMKELPEIIQRIQPPSALFVSAVSADKYGNSLNEYDVANEIQRRAQVPVFSGYYAMVMDGFVGGALTSGSDVGSQCGKMALDMLLHPQKSRPRVTFPEIKYLYDYRMLEKFDVDLKLLPQHATIRFEPENFWKKHKRVLIISGLIILQLLAIIALMFRYLANQRMFKQKLLKAMKKANESDRLKSVFLANISHEFRTPLNSIVGFSDILSELYEESDDFEKKLYVDQISANAIGLNHTINHVFDFSLLESHSVHLEQKRFQIRELIDALLQQLNPTIEKLYTQDIRIQSYIDPKHSECSIHADYNKIFQMMNNLIENAINNTQKGEIEFGFKLCSPVSSPVPKSYWPNRSKPFVYFFVRDTGKGIATKDQHIIFKPFRQVYESTVDANRGMGIGLSICKSLVSLMGGKIGFESEENKGSLFFFTLPLDHHQPVFD
jgi:signal transduction histidine kinase